MGNIYHKIINVRNGSLAFLAFVIFHFFVTPHIHARPFVASFHGSFENELDPGVFVSCAVKDVGFYLEVFAEELQCKGEQALDGVHFLNVIGKTVNANDDKYYFNWQITGPVTCRCENINLDEAGTGTMTFSCDNMGVHWAVRLPGYGIIENFAGISGFTYIVYLENGQEVDASFEENYAGVFDFMSQEEFQVIESHLCP